MTENMTNQPHLEVVAGNPTEEELAVVVAVLQAAASAAAAANAATTRKRVASWHRNSTVLRDTIIPGHGQWTASSRRGLV